ncbi:MAG: hypothetical protein QXI12_04400 [Candidatus Methanomethyliaceae archaeon]
MSQDKRISPATETKSMLQFTFPTEVEVALAVGAVREVDPRLWMLLHSVKGEYQELAISCLIKMVSMTPNSSKLFAYLIRAFPEAMRNVNITLQQPIALKSQIPMGSDQDMAKE